MANNWAINDWITGYENDGAPFPRPNRRPGLVALLLEGMPGACIKNDYYPPTSHTCSLLVLEEDGWVSHSGWDPKPGFPHFPYGWAVSLERLPWAV